VAVSFYYHPIEEQQYGVVIDYVHEHPEAHYLIDFAEGESYVCEFFTAFQSENGGELDIEMDDPRYDEFHVVCMTIIHTVSDGPRRYNDSLSLDYRDFPATITDADTGAVVYPSHGVTEG
jgi:hypothetical protein